MRRCVNGLAITLGMLVAAVPALAQEKKIQVNIGGGYTATTGEVHNHLGDGGNFMLGITFNPSPRVGVQFEYGYTPVGDKIVDIPYVTPSPDNAPISAGHHMHQYTFNAIGRFAGTDAKVRPVRDRRRRHLQSRRAVDVPWDGPRDSVRSVVVHLLSGRRPGHEYSR